MKISNLIMTPTHDMTREQWLEFRSPVFHVTQFLKDFYQQRVNNKGMKEGYLTSSNAYEYLKFVFASDEWKEFIFPCVGASEIASITGHNPYKAIIELYYEKVGIKEVYNEDNAAMYWGRTLEETIAEQWQYWDGSIESLFLNARLGKPVRKCRRINFYVQNKETPWIFVSLDRIINKYAGKEEGSLECKTISEWAAKMWENGIPPMYVVQLQTQLGTFEFDHGEMALLKDGRNFEVLPFDFAPDIWNRVKEESRAFFDMVKCGIEHYFLWKACPENLIMENDVVAKDFHLSRIEYFSPEPDNSLAYENYLSETYRSEFEGGREIVGNEEHVHIARAYNYYAKREKAIQGMQRECSNRIMEIMKDASILNLGEAGKVTWKTNKAGSRVLRFGSVKPEGADFKPDPELIKSHVEEEKVEDPLF